MRRPLFAFDYLIIRTTRLAAVPTAPFFVAAPPDSGARKETMR